MPISERLISVRKNKEDEKIYPRIRPATLADYLGQTSVCDQMTLFIRAARARAEALDHVLIVGPPGLGKTTLANIIAREMGVSLKQTSGPVLERAGDLAALLTHLEANEVLFIDDGSTDNTAAVARQLGVQHIVRHSQNRGGCRRGLPACRA